MQQMNQQQLEMFWNNDARWKGITRPYTAKDVVRLRGTVQIEYTLARIGAERLWKLFHQDEYVSALGALTGNQALQQVQAGLKSIYLSGWQVAGDANLAGQMYPDQSLYPSNSVPAVAKEINNAFLRADQINCAEGKNGTYWFAPIVADAEAGFGGSLNAFELMKAMIEAGAAGVHFEEVGFGEEMRPSWRKGPGSCSRVCAETGCRAPCSRHPERPNSFDRTHGREWSTPADHRQRPS